MPYFNTNPPGSMTASIRRLIGGGGGELDPMQAMQIDRAAADTAHKLSLIEELRSKSEERRGAAAMRANPNAQSQFASDYAGTDTRTGRRLFGHLRGEKEQPSTADYEDASIVGIEAQPFDMAAPNVEPVVRQRMQDALAALGANAMGTSPTNAEQLLHAAGRSQEQRVFSTAAEAAKRGDVSQVNLNAAGVLGKHELTPFKTNESGLTTNEWTGSAPNAPNALFVNKVREVEAKARQAALAAEASGAHAGLFRAQTDVARGEGGKGKPPTGYMWGPLNSTTGQPTLVKIEGGPVDTGKQLPNAGVKDLAAAGTAVEDTARLAGSFDPKFGGKTILGDLSNTYKRIVGDATGQAQWWQDMDALQNQTRHALFGSALTKTELEAWKKTSVTPRMEAEQIQENLQRRQKIEARAASKLARSYEAAGYNKEQIAELLGVGAQYLQNAAPPVAGQNAKGRIGAPRRAPVDDPLGLRSR